MSRDGTIKPGKNGTKYNFFNLKSSFIFWVELLLLLSTGKKCFIAGFFHQNSFVHSFFHHFLIVLTFFHLGESSSLDNSIKFTLSHY